MPEFADPMDSRPWEPPPPPTADALVVGIRNALEAQDMPAVSDMLRTLALVDPVRAHDLVSLLSRGLNAAARVQASIDILDSLGREPGGSGSEGGDDGHR